MTTRLLQFAGLRSLNRLQIINESIEVLVRGLPSRFSSRFAQIAPDGHGVGPVLGRYIHCSTDNRPNPFLWKGAPVALAEQSQIGRQSGGLTNGGSVSFAVVAVAAGASGDVDLAASRSTVVGWYGTRSHLDESNTKDQENGHSGLVLSARHLALFEPAIGKPFDASWAALPGT